MERNVLEFVDHLHEHFITPCSINSNGRYNVPLNPHEGYRYVDPSISLREMIVIVLYSASFATITFPALRCTNPVFLNMNGQTEPTGKVLIRVSSPKR